MHGGVLLGERTLYLREFPGPTPRPGEVFIAIQASGMVGADLHPPPAPRTAAYGALKRLDVSGRDTLAVFGQGPVGLSATQLGCAMGARVIAVDLAAERRRLAKEFGAETVIDPRETDPAAALRELTHGEGVEAALDCTGNPEARVAAVRSACTWGRVCFVGEGNTTTFDISQDLIRKQLTI